MRSFVKLRDLTYVGLVLLFIAAVGPLSGTAQANSNWKLLKGQSECGGIDASGRLQPACGFTRAEKVSKALGTCPKGSFFDLGTWSCFTCPDGYNRNARSVDSDKACDKPVGGAIRSSANFDGKKECPVGAFMDGRNGGECWSCPSGYGRTAASVDAHNACGMIGKKARTAVFEGRACPVDSSFTDPRNGGECWSCPEGFKRTGNSVTSNSACIKVLDFQPAIKEAALTCEPGQIFDFVDGGTCWTCPDNSRRSVSGVKTAKACEYKSFVWATPNRDMPGLFGLGSSAEEMAAQLIVSRTEIDAAILQAAQKTKQDVDMVSQAVWKLIDEEPWNSAPLHAVILEQTALAVKKPVAQRTDAEKNFIATLEQYIQWNRQFIAYQSKQAHETWKASTAAVLAERGKGNLVALYGGVITPPDFAGIVNASISGASGVGMLTGAYLSGFLAGKFAFVAPYSVQIAEKAAGAAVGTYIATGGNAISKVFAAASGPVSVAIAVAITTAMELDKFVKLDVAESKINQAVELSNLPVDLNVFLQQKDGEEQLGYHWSLLTSGSTKPSAGFKARIAMLKGDTDGSEARPMPTILGGTLLGTTQTAAAAPAEPPTASKAQTTAYIKMNQQTADTIRFELSAAPGLCVSKLHKHSQGLALRDCDDKGTMWIQPNSKNSTLVFAQRFCIVVDGSRLADQVPVLVTECQAPSNAKNWQLTREGMVQSLRSRFCMSVSGPLAKDSPIVLARCDNTAGQVWRPWSATN